jgi:hypothetical protein
MGIGERGARTTQFLTMLVNVQFMQAVRSCALSIVGLWKDSLNYVSYRSVLVETEVLARVMMTVAR